MRKVGSFWFHPRGPCWGLGGDPRGGQAAPSPEACERGSLLDFMPPAEPNPEGRSAGKRVQFAATQFRGGCYTAVAD